MHNEIAVVFDETLAMAFNNNMISYSREGVKEVGIDDTPVGQLLNNNFFQNGLGDCSDESETLLYNATTGTFSCGTDSGSGGSSSLWATTTDLYAIYPTDTSDVVIIGRNSTSTDAQLEVFGEIAAATFTATSTTATSTLPYTHITGLRIGTD